MGEDEKYNVHGIERGVGPRGPASPRATAYRWPVLRLSRDPGRRTSFFTDEELFAGAQRHTASQPRIRRRAATHVVSGPALALYSNAHTINCPPSRKEYS